MDRFNGYSNFATLMFHTEIDNHYNTYQSIKTFVAANPLVTVAELAQHLQSYNSIVRKLNSGVNLNQVNYVEIANDILLDVLQMLEYNQ